MKIILISKYHIIDFTIEIWAQIFHKYDKNDICLKERLTIKRILTLQIFIGFREKYNKKRYTALIS